MVRVRVIFQQRLRDLEEGEEEVAVASVVVVAVRNPFMSLLSFCRFFFPPGPGEVRKSITHLPASMSVTSSCTNNLSSFSTLKNPKTFKIKIY